MAQNTFLHLTKRRVIHAKGRLPHQLFMTVQHSFHSDKSRGDSFHISDSMRIFTGIAQAWLTNMLNAD